MAENSEPRNDWRSELFARAFAQNHLCILLLDIDSGKAQALKAGPANIGAGVVIPWESVVELSLQSRVFPDDRRLLRELTLARIRKIFESGKSHSVEVRFLTDSEECVWRRISFSGAQSGQRQLMVAMSDMDESAALKKVVELFILKDYDYLFLLDARRNSFTQLSVNRVSRAEFPAPPKSGGDYEGVMRLYNERFVAAGELESVNEKMSLPNVVKMLENSETYTFCCNVTMLDGAYARVRVQFMYYDRKASLILLSRSDITQLYEEALVMGSNPEKAISQAQYDSLTGLRSHGAMLKLAGDALAGRGLAPAAVLLVNIDSFGKLNESKGRREADMLLCALAQSIRESAADGEIAGRVGGGKFMLFIPQLKSAGELNRRVAEIREALTANAPFQATVSVGAAIYPNDGADVDELAKNAAAALDAARRSGESKTAFFSPVPNAYESSHAVPRNNVVDKRKIGIVGLGIIGGSLAYAISEYTAHTVIGCDLDAATLESALAAGAISACAPPHGLGGCDVIFLALYPRDAIAFVREHIGTLKAGCLLVDLCGVKGVVANELRPLCKAAAITYVGCHPMAGKERWGFESADRNLYKNAAMIMTPFDDTPPEQLAFLRELFTAAGFDKLPVTTPDDHDSMIAFTSQLAHVVSSAYIKSPRAYRHRGFSAGSYRDLTRVARLNPDMWTELFLDNREALVTEIDTIISHLNEYRDAISTGDAERLYRLLDEGRAIKEDLDFEKN